MANFSIKDLAELSGIKPHTIRIWEQRYTFLHPQRSPSLRRTYSAEELHVLLDVTLLNQNGHKISRIDKMSLEEKLLLLSQITDQQQKSIHDLIIAMANMSAETFEASLNQSIAQWGLHHTIEQVLLPFSDMAGLLHGNSNKNYAENVTVILQPLKQKLYLAMEQAAPVTPVSKKVLLYVPSGEPDEITLLYLQYLLKLSGYTTLNLGTVSVAHLQLICKHTAPDFVITHSRKNDNSKKTEIFINSLPSFLPQATFISLENDLSTNSKQYRHAPSISEAMDIITGEAEIP